MFFDYYKKGQTKYSLKNHYLYNVMPLLVKI